MRKGCLAKARLPPISTAKRGITSQRNHFPHGALVPSGVSVGGAAARCSLRLSSSSVVAAAALRVPAVGSSGSWLDEKVANPPVASPLSIAPFGGAAAAAPDDEYASVCTHIASRCSK